MNVCTLVLLLIAWVIYPDGRFWCLVVSAAVFALLAIAAEIRQAVRAAEKRAESERVE